MVPRWGLAAASTGSDRDFSGSALARSSGVWGSGLSMLAVGESMGEGSSWRREARVSSEAL